MSVLCVPGVPPSLTAVTVMLLTALPVAAQPRIFPGAKGFQTTMIVQEYMQARELQASPLPPVPARQSYRWMAPSVGVDVNLPNVAPPTSGPTTYVTIRGPGGEARRFPLAGSVEVKYVQRHIVLRPGESTTVRLTPVP